VTNPPATPRRQISVTAQCAAVGAGVAAANVAVAATTQPGLRDAMIQGAPMLLPQIAAMIVGTAAGFFLFPTFRSLFPDDGRAGSAFAGAATSATAMGLAMIGVSAVTGFSTAVPPIGVMAVNLVLGSLIGGTLLHALWRRTRSTAA
jgi:hypothetical protein